MENFIFSAVTCEELKRLILLKLETAAKTYFSCIFTLTFRWLFLEVLERKEFWYRFIIKNVKSDL